jgi:hypothetical protein
MKKYKTIKDKTTGLLRIKALIDIPSVNVKVGDLGGLIENEFNLSHVGLCWVYRDAEVSGNARVYGNAWVYGDAIVCKENADTNTPPKEMTL